MPPPRSAADSPWFWAYLFTTSALIALAVIGPKFARRQAQIEREFQGRQRAAQAINGQQPTGELSTAERTMVTLQPLFLGVAAMTTIAWIFFWRNRRSAGAGPPAPRSEFRAPRSSTDP
jgi:hypothetical protein